MVRPQHTRQHRFDNAVAGANTPDNIDLLMWSCGPNTPDNINLLMWWWAPYAATKCVRGVPKCGRRRHASAATGVFGGTPYGDTVHVKGVPGCGGAAMRALPLEPSVGLPLGHGAREGCAKMGAAPPCERGH